MTTRASTPNPARWAIFVSGQGSNAAELIDARDEHEIALMVSSKALAPALLRARRAGIETVIIGARVNWSELLQILEQKRITHIFLAGFMKVIPVEFLEKWKGLIVNIHPSLLPEYPGMQSISRAYMDQKPVGVTTHHVTSEVDGGEIILQSPVMTMAEQMQFTLDEVQFRTHLREHELVQMTMEKLG